MEHANDRLGAVEHLADGQELVEQVAGARHRRGAAGDGDSEAANRTTVHVLDTRVPANIVDRRSDVILGAAFKGNLELAWKHRAQRMPEQITRQCLGVGRDVEGFVARDAGIRARGDIPHRIAARFARRHAGSGELAHRRFGIVQLDEMQLDVLARGDVTEATRVALGDAGDRIELLAAQDALRNLDAQHLRIGVLALAVGAAQQTERAPLVGADVAVFEPREQGDELVDVRLFRERKARAPERFAVLHDSHYCPPAAASSLSACALRIAPSRYDFTYDDGCGSVAISRTRGQRRMRELPQADRPDTRRWRARSTYDRCRRQGVPASREHELGNLFNPSQTHHHDDRRAVRRQTFKDRAVGVLGMARDDNKAGRHASVSDRDAGEPCCCDRRAHARHDLERRCRRRRAPAPLRRRGRRRTGSPPFSRTTFLRRRAAANHQLMDDIPAASGRPGVLFRRRSAARSAPARAWPDRPAHRRAPRRHGEPIGAFRVSRSGSPGPAPTSETKPRSVSGLVMMYVGLAARR